jgi:hypothetical protein
LEKLQNEKKQEKDLFDGSLSALTPRFHEDRGYSGSQKYSVLLVKGALSPLIQDSFGPRPRIYEDAVPKI